jgi:hypothetical protein
MYKTTSIFLTVSLAVLVAIGFFFTYASAQNPSNPDPNIVKGGITSIQDDDPNDNTDWITGGAYKMENITSGSPSFNSTFYMIKTDGTAAHTHDIYNFVATGQPTTNGNSTSFNGTSTVTMRGEPITDVQTYITLLGTDAISISVDPEKVNNHFGNTSIYGTQHLICVEAPQLCQ